VGRSARARVADIASLNMMLSGASVRSIVAAVSGLPSRSW
jgi:hypothetical protein